MKSHDFKKLALKGIIAGGCIIASQADAAAITDSNVSGQEYLASNGCKGGCHGAPSPTTPSSTPSYPSNQGSDDESNQQNPNRVRRPYSNGQNTGNSQQGNGQQSNGQQGNGQNQNNGHRGSCAANTPSNGQQGGNY